ncbi:hypothetical protein D3C76_1821080 [compost metagenome]
MTGQAHAHECLAGDGVRILGLRSFIGAEAGTDLTLPLVAIVLLFLDHRERVFFDLAFVGTDH